MRIRGLTTILVLAGGLPACRPRVIDVGPSTTDGEVEAGEPTTSEPTLESTGGEPCDPQGNADDTGADGPCKPGFKCQAVPGNPDVFVCQKPKP